MDLKTYIATSERGTATRLAASLGVSKSYLSQMASGESPISPARAVVIEQFSGGICSRKDIYPDDWPLIWPELSKQRRKVVREIEATDDVQPPVGRAKSKAA